jgi:hypothetical protein
MAASIPRCTHDLRPGTTVCLRCQHAERGAHRANQRRMIARGGAAVLSLAMIAAVGVTAFTTFRARSGGSAPASTELVVPTTDSMSTGEQEADSAAAPMASEPTSAGVVMAQPAPSSPQPQPTPIAAPPVAPRTAIVTAKQVPLVVPVGRSELRDTMIAERAGDTVRVSFDLLLSRTRRPDKFEAIMRSTLPQVYGASVDSALRALPEGAIARAGDLMTTLPERGFHIPLTDGRTIGVWPVTRVGRDGPLVVAYRAVASR